MLLARCDRSPVCLYRGKKTLSEHFAAMDTPYCCSFPSHNSPERQEILLWLMVVHTHCPDPSTQTDLVLSHAPAHTNAGGEGGERKYNKPHSKQ